MEMRYNESYKSEDELLCEIIMRPKGQLENCLFSLHTLLKEENMQFVHLVEYKDLVLDPEKEIEKIYDFLGIEKFSHKYHYIHQFQINDVQYDDTMWQGDLHKLNKKIKFSDYEVSDVLSPSLIQKYSNLEFWRN